MAHSLGGWRDLAHGECNSILLDHVVRFNWPAAEKRYRRLGRAMGLELDALPAEAAREALVDAIARFKRQVGIQRRLRDCGVQRKDFPVLARNAINDPCMATNPILPAGPDIEAIYEEAF
jgi:alcohol dehydrogenase class IV